MRLLSKIGSMLLLLVIGVVQAWAADPKPASQFARAEEEDPESGSAYLPETSQLVTEHLEFSHPRGPACVTGPLCWSSQTDSTEIRFIDAQPTPMPLAYFSIGAQLDFVGEQHLHPLAAGVGERGSPTLTFCFNCEETTKHRNDTDQGLFLRQFELDFWDTQSCGDPSCHFNMFEENVNLVNHMDINTRIFASRSTMSGHCAVPGESAVDAVGNYCWTDGDCPSSGKCEGLNDTDFTWQMGPGGYCDDDPTQECDWDADCALGTCMSTELVRFNSGNQGTQFLNGEVRILPLFNGSIEDSFVVRALNVNAELASQDVGTAVTFQGLDLKVSVHSETTGVLKNVRGGKMSVEIVDGSLAKQISNDYSVLKLEQLYNTSATGTDVNNMVGLKVYQDWQDQGTVSGRMAGIYIQNPTVPAGASPPWNDGIKVGDRGGVGSNVSAIYVDSQSNDATPTGDKAHALRTVVGSCADGNLRLGDLHLWNDDDDGPRWADASLDGWCSDDDDGHLIPYRIDHLEDVSSAVPLPGQVLVWSGAAWVPGSSDAGSSATAMRAGHWYGPGTLVEALGVETGANTAWFDSICLGQTATFDEWGFYVTRGGAPGASIRAVVYADDGAGAPGALIRELGQLFAVLPGELNALIDGGDLTLGPGCYWIGVVGNDTLLQTRRFRKEGHAGYASLSDTGGTVYSRAFVFGDVWPDPWLFTDGETIDVHMPAVMLRVRP